MRIARSEDLFPKSPIRKPLIECDECKRDVDVICEIRADNSHDDIVWVCLDCLRKATAMLEAATEDERE